MAIATQRLSLAAAETLANELAGLLRHGTKRIVVCGSIRRKRQDVGDIDLLCEPITMTEYDLFGQPTGKIIDRLDDAANVLLADGVLEKRLNIRGSPSWGLLLKRAVFKGVGVDIRSCSNEETWGSWLVIATGPAEFNRRLVTHIDQGGSLPCAFQFKDGFRLHRGSVFIPTPTEEAVFAAIGMEFVKPEERR